jgi:hypothetical protein
MQGGLWCCCRLPSLLSHAVCCSDSHHPQAAAQRLGLPLVYVLRLPLYEQPSSILLVAIARAVRRATHLQWRKNCSSPQLQSMPNILAVPCVSGATQRRNK